MAPGAGKDLRSFTLSELQQQLAAWGEPLFRAKQVLRWIYDQRVTQIETMTNLPLELRQRLGVEFTLRPFPLIRHQAAPDGTRKFLWQLADGALIESVLMPANPALYGEGSDRSTLCISTQVGCAYGCRFCASGLDGWKRNLEPDEIVEQLLAIERQQVCVAPPDPQSTSSDCVESPHHTPETVTGPGHIVGGTELIASSRGSHDAFPNTVNRESRTSLAVGNQPTAIASKLLRPSSPVPDRLVSNIVIMGMGEPLANYDHLLKALHIINAPWGAQIGARKITVSTSGLVPEIRRLADQPFQFQLAVSLHGATDAVRGQIMPVNRKYPLSELIDACDYYQWKKGRMITFEYILIAGINDDLGQVRPLAQLARRVHAKVNLIPYNRVEGLPWERPADVAQEAFLHALTQLGVTATLRREKGHDIAAACGQLRLKTEREAAVARQ
jgi:adenine C2-methylase RlmN of 23S rRNA A2503 and tRNA A37